MVSSKTQQERDSRYTNLIKKLAISEVMNLRYLHDLIFILFMLIHKKCPIQFIYFINISFHLQMYILDVLGYQDVKAMYVAHLQWWHCAYKIKPLVNVF